MSRTALDAIGGLRPLVDYTCGRFRDSVTASPKPVMEVVLARCCRGNPLARLQFRGFFEHQMRWGAQRAIPAARLRWLAADLRPSVAILAVLFAPLSWCHGQRSLFAAALRAAVRNQSRSRVVHDRAVWRHLWLGTIRDLVAFGVWFASFADHTVHWRGDSIYSSRWKIRPAHPREPGLVSAAKPIGTRFRPFVSTTLPPHFAAHTLCSRPHNQEDALFADTPPPACGPAGLNVGQKKKQAFRRAKAFQKPRHHQRSAARPGTLNPYQMLLQRPLKDSDLMPRVVIHAGSRFINLLIFNDCAGLPILFDGLRQYFDESTGEKITKALMGRYSRTVVINVNTGSPQRRGCGAARSGSKLFPARTRIP